MCVCDRATSVVCVHVVVHVHDVNMCMCMWMCLNPCICVIAVQASPCVLNLASYMQVLVILMMLSNSKLLQFICCAELITHPEQHAVPPPLVHEPRNNENNHVFHAHRHALVGGQFTLLKFRSDAHLGQWWWWQCWWQSRWQLLQWCWWQCCCSTAG